MTFIDRTRSLLGLIKEQLRRRIRVLLCLLFVRFLTISRTAFYSDKEKFLLNAKFFVRLKGRCSYMNKFTTEQSAVQQESTDRRSTDQQQAFTYESTIILLALRL